MNTRSKKLVCLLLTLMMLFSLMTIVAGFRHMGAFDKLAGAVTAKIHTLRGLAMVLTAACFLLAMVATNDVALITFVPLTAALLVLNLMSPLWGESVGIALNAALVIVSAPMVCSNFYALPLFLWGMLLAAAFKKK